MEKDVPFMVYQGTMARFERTIKRLVWVLILTIVLLFGSNFYWAYLWSHCDYAEVTVDGKEGGNAAYMGDGASGVINNGQSDSTDENTKE